MRLPALLLRHAPVSPSATATVSNSTAATPSPSADGLPDDTQTNRIAANARREFASVFGDLARGKRNWQLIAFALAGILAVETIGTVRLAFTAHVVPYIVRVDQLGQVSPGAPAEPLGDPDAKLVASQLADVIRSVRTVLPAAAASAQTSMLRHGYAFAAPEAAAFLNAYFGDRAHDPRVLGARLVRQVDVISALKIPDGTKTGARNAPGVQTWRLQWTETDRPTQPGDSTRVTAWEGYVTVRVVPPTTAESVQENPLGLYITSIAWTRVGERPSPDGASPGGQAP
jgi:type IV secretory pathway TrbF-like protein